MAGNLECLVGKSTEIIKLEASQIIDGEPLTKYYAILGIGEETSGILISDKPSIDVLARSIIDVLAKPDVDIIGDSRHPYIKLNIIDDNKTPYFYMGREEGILSYGSKLSDEEIDLFLGSLIRYQIQFNSQ